MKITMFTKMLLLSGAILLILALIVAFSLFAFSLVQKQEKFSKTEVLLLESSQSRLELLVRRDSVFNELYQQNFQNILNNLRKIDSISTFLTDDNRIVVLSAIRQEYEQSIKNYVEQLAKLGLNENDGLEGRMRSRIHKIEKILRNINLDNAQVYVLQARRREKDFIMRNRREYIDSVKIEMSRAIEIVSNSNIEQAKKSEILELASEYLKLFKEFVIVSNELNNLEHLMNNIELKYKKLIREIVANESERVNNLQSSLVYLFFTSIVVSILLSVVVSKSITKPLKGLQEATLQLTNGNMDTKVEILSKDELGNLALFFNNMVDSLNVSNKTILEQQSKLSKQYNELKQMNVTKDKFFSIIAHDLKNPISSFLSLSDFLVGKFNDLSKDEIKEFLDEVHVSAKNVYELLENLLLWSRSQRGLIQFYPINLDLNTIIANNINLLQINAERKNIEIAYLLSANFQVYADPNMLNTILRNLITNATKFTPENGHIVIKAMNSLSDNNFCIVSVSDNGIGIAKENLDKLFQLEHSFTTNGTNKEKGTGLGLVLCKEFIEFHKGKIWVESELHKGSTFSFTLQLIN